ncbi:hypothetical protein [Hydrogenophaga sp. 2FB]|uniref:hypothetical protein n=1 Tax=Hydrogenophaga sp. 2FB TaxID=2502187 RepID=UPI001BB259E0|nr:hypothetical protein [Hydrogenophaga sp. 2FB]
MSDFTAYPHPKRQSLSRRRLEGLISGGQPVKTILQVILADEWGMNHLVCGMGGELQITAGASHTFLKFCCLHRRFDVLRAVFESEAVANRFRSSTQMEMLEALFTKAVVNVSLGPHRTKAELMPHGVSWAQAAARHAMPEMLDYALKNLGATTRYAFPEGDVYSSVFLSLLTGAMDESIVSDGQSIHPALECSRVLMKHDPTRGEGASESLATSVLAASPSSRPPNSLVQTILNDHFVAGKISWGEGVHTGALPGQTMIDAAVHAQNASFAMAIVDFRFKDPGFFAELEAIQSIYTAPASISLAREAMTHYRSLLMLNVIEESRSPASAASSGDEGNVVINIPKPRRLRLV